MTEQELTDSLKPGEWVVDTSPHRYKVKGKTLVRFEWEAVSKDGAYKKGFALTQQDAESKAQKWADHTKWSNPDQDTIGQKQES